MKIGIDCRLWDESGVGRYIRNLVNELLRIDRNNEYILFIRNKDWENIKYPFGPSSGREQISNIKNAKWKIVEADIRWHSVREQLVFPSVINRENLDLIHFPYFSVPILYKKPYVVTIHDLIINHFNTGKASTLFYPTYVLKRFGYNFIINQAAKNSRKIIAVSKTTKNEIIDHFGVEKDKIVVTYEGIDENLLTDKEQSINIKKPYFLYVGNAYPHKNLERLIKAFELLILNNKDVSLMLVGKEDYFYKRLRGKVQKMNLKGRIFFYKEAKDEELVGLYKNAISLVLPSLMEGFGLPAVEAMANQCLVLASNIKSLQEICGDCAIYFDPYSVNDLFQKMEEILHYNNTYHYSDKIEKGRERSKLFSWEKMAKETLKVYESCFSLRSS